MALTIKELEIRIRVGDDEQPAAPSEAPSGAAEVLAWWSTVTITRASSTRASAACSSP